MNNTFKRGFSSGFFSKGFFNNKIHLNCLKSSVNPTSFKINFSNKFFMTRMLVLNKSKFLTSQIGNAQIVSGSMSALEDITDTESSVQSELNEGIIQIGDLFLFKDDCKWTCLTRLVSGPQSPV